MTDPLKVWETTIVNKARRLGELVGRDLNRKDGRSYYTVYLAKENKPFLETHPKKPKMKMIYKYPKSDEKWVELLIK